MLKQDLYKHKKYHKREQIFVGSHLGSAFSATQLISPAENEPTCS